MNWVGVVIFVPCAILLFIGLSTGRIPSRWILIDRDRNPDFFWTHIVVWGLGAFLGIFITLMSLLRVLLLKIGL
jgi:hypothetical protein